MLNVNDLRRASWRRRSAGQRYDGYVTVTDDVVRLTGREDATGIDASLSIPLGAIRDVWSTGAGDLVLDVADGVPILLRPAGGARALERLERLLG
jgi:hypothetical protein